MESHEDGRAAQQAFGVLRQDLDNFRASLATSEEIAGRVQKHQALVTDVDSVPESTAGETATSTGEDSDLDMGFSSLAPTPPVAPAPSSLLPPKPRRKKRDEAGSAPANACQLDGEIRKPAPIDIRQPSPGSTNEQQHVQPKRLPQPTGKTKSKAAKKAEKVLDTKGPLLADQDLWDGKKSRAVDQAAKALESAAGELLGEAGSEEMMESMLRLSDMGPKKFALFQKIRKEYTGLIGGMDREDSEVLADVNTDTLKSILSSVAMFLIKDMEQDRELTCRWMAISYLIGTVSCDLLHLKNLSFHSKVGQQAASLVALMSRLVSFLIHVGIAGHRTRASDFVLRGPRTPPWDRVQPVFARIRGGHG